MTLIDGSPLPTERVTSSRRAPLVVVLAVFALVALFIWKPWAGQATPSPSPSSVAVRPTATPTLTVPPASAAPTPTPGPTAVPNVDVGWIDPFVECHYELRVHPRKLTKLVFFPPLVVLHPDGIGEPITEVRWRALLESNMEQTLSTAPWEVARTSPWRPAADRADTNLRAVFFDYGKAPVGPTVVARVEIVVQWLGPGGFLRGSQSVIPASYDNGFTNTILPEGCHTYT